MIGVTSSENSSKPVAVILGVTADIGREICLRLLRDGWRVVGLGRTETRIAELLEHDDFSFHRCDLSDRTSIETAVRADSFDCRGWKLFISSAGTMEPIGPFFQTCFDDWEDATTVNFTAQLRVLHAIWPQRRQDAIVDVMYLAGGGTNNPFPNYSAYCVAKIALIKMCELIHDEEEGVNAFIVGPGFVRTKIHEETLRSGDLAGDGLKKTEAFLETEGTSFDEIYYNLRWCMEQGRDVAGGRNFSTVHDGWRNGGVELSSSLRDHADAHRLRRYIPD